jgi:hypothetical protein
VQLILWWKNALSSKAGINMYVKGRFPARDTPFGGLKQNTLAAYAVPAKAVHAKL